MTRDYLSVISAATVARSPLVSLIVSYSVSLNITSSGPV